MVLMTLLSVGDSSKASKMTSSSSFRMMNPAFWALT